MDRRKFFKALGVSAAAIVITPSILIPAKQEEYSLSEETNKLLRELAEYPRTPSESYFVINNLVLLGDSQYIITSIHNEKLTLMPINPNNQVIEATIKDDILVLGSLYPLQSWQS